MTAAKIGYGCQFKRGNADGPPETFTAIGEVFDITGPGMSKDTPDATHHESPDSFREFIAGLKNGGEFGVQINYDPGSTDTANAIADYRASTSRTYQMVWPDGTIFEFEAHCINWSPEQPLEDKMVLGLSYKVTGSPTFTQA